MQIQILIPPLPPWVKSFKLNSITIFTTHHIPRGKRHASLVRRGKTLNGQKLGASLQASSTVRQLGSPRNGHV